MAIETDGRIDTQTRRTRMIDEFRHAQERRRSRTLNVNATAEPLNVNPTAEPSPQDGTAGDADSPADRDSVVITQP